MLYIVLCKRAAADCDDDGDDDDDDDERAFMADAAFLYCAIACHRSVNWQDAPSRNSITDMPQSARRSVCLVHHLSVGRRVPGTVPYDYSIVLIVRTRGIEETLRTKQGNKQKNFCIVLKLQLPHQQRKPPSDTAQHVVLTESYCGKAYQDAQIKESRRRAFPRKHAFFRMPAVGCCKHPIPLSVSINSQTTQ